MSDYTPEEAQRLRMAWPCPCCGGSSAHYPANHAQGCALRAAVGAIEAHGLVRKPT